MDEKSLSLALSEFSSSATIYSYEHQQCLVTYTEGIKFLQDETSCLWLIDEIADRQTLEFRHQNIWQSWQLDVFNINSSHASAQLIYHTSDSSPSVARHLKYCDFPLPSITIWLEVMTDRVVMYLPNEY
jgi:hypothetical protein